MIKKILERKKWRHFGKLFSYFFEFFESLKYYKINKNKYFEILYCSSDENYVCAKDVGAIGQIDFEKS